MPIPDFQSLMLPLLQHFADGEEHANQETLDALAGLLQLTATERAQLLPSGKQALFTNRVAWAKSHLKQAGLIDSPRRGVYRITAHGGEVLRHPPDTITMRFLDQFPSYRTFRTQTKADVQVGESPPSNTLTPQEHIESGYQQLRVNLAAELLTRLIREIGQDVPTDKNAAKQMAVALHEKLPVVYAAGPLVEVMRGAYRAVRKRLPKPIETALSSTYADLNVLAEMGIPAIKCGPAPEDPRLKPGTGEVQKIQDLVDAAKMYAAAALEVCNNLPVR